MYLIMTLKGTHTRTLTGVDITSQYNATRALRTKKASETAFVCEATYQKGDAFKYPKMFHCDNGSEFKSNVTKLLEKNIVDVRKTTRKYKNTLKAFVEAFKKELAKQLFKPMDDQELQDPEKVSTI